MSAADLKVTPTELQVTLAPLSSPHRSRAMAALCEELNSQDACFPGSTLRLRYAVHGVASAWSIAINTLAAWKNASPKRG